MRSPLSTLLPFLATILLLLAPLTSSYAYPGGGPPIQKAGKKEEKLIPNERATWNCSHKYKVMYSHYKLSGRDWNKTEKEIKRAVSNEGIITRWKFAINVEEDTFESSFNLPLGRASALGKSTSMLLGINKQLKNETSGKKNKGVDC